MALISVHFTSNGDKNGTTVNYTLKYLLIPHNTRKTWQRCPFCSQIGWILLLSAWGGEGNFLGFYSLDG